LLLKELPPPLMDAGFQLKTTILTGAEKVNEENEGYRRCAARRLIDLMGQSSYLEGR